MGKLLSLVAVASITLPVAFTSCNTSGCTDLRSATPLATFYSANTGEAIGLDSIQIAGIGAPGDSILLAPGTKASQIYLPFRATKSETSWCISYKWQNLNYAALNDTVTFCYDAQPWFASADCGAMFRYQIKDVRHTTHLIDSIAVLDSLITNVDASQISIYFRTSDE
jgi:hypothetical protein